jgi:hypothetical protein
LPEDGGMYALQPQTGEVIWFAPDPVQFVSVSPGRIYTRDVYGRIAILDAKSGARIDTFQLTPFMKTLVNDQSDRLYLYTTEGLIQCIREAALEQPFLNAPPKVEAPKKGAPAPAAAPAGADAPAASN